MTKPDMPKSLQSSAETPAPNFSVVDTISTDKKYLRDARARHIALLNRARPTTRLNLTDAVDDLAPAPPPCFLNRISWREYLRSAAAAQNNKAEPKVILIAHDGAATFNHAFPFCSDCTQVKSVEMMAAGRCNPQFLQQLGERNERIEAAD